MLFNSFVFVFAFLPIVFIGYFLLGKLKNKDIATLFLVASSLFFYCFYEIKFLLLISASILVNYFIGNLLMKSTNNKKWIISIGIIFNIGLLCYFKYADFFIENFNAVFNEDIALLNIALPLGISFITFQQIAYLVDIYRGEITRSKFSNYMIFITFFPQLIAGPIVNHKDVMPDYENPENKRVKWDNVSKGLFVFLIGLVKKIVIADTFAIWVSDGFTNYESLTFAESWFVIVAYTVQLYFDFSGYCDMAIGLALMFNIHIPMNFNSPYKARNIHEFWRRWHMTLNRFLTKYVYFPLGGSRKGEVITWINIIIVFFISGFWHGAGWTFIIWGMLHGVGSVTLRIVKKFTPIKLPFVMSWAITFLFIVLARVYFRSDSVAQAHHMFSTLFSPNLHSIEAFFTIPPEIFVTAANILVFDYPLNTPIILIGSMIIMLAICFFAKNSMQLLEQFTFSWKQIFYVQFLAVLLFATMFFVKKSSVFIYFNF